MNHSQKRNISLLVAGRLISLIGSGVQGIAIPLYILDKTGSGTLMGLFATLSMVPALVAAPLSGVLGDRLNRKKLMVYADCGRGILIFLLALLSAMDTMNIAVLFTVQAMTSILDSMFNSSSDGILPDLIPHEDLGRANAMKGGADSLALIIGPVLGGIIYGIWGIFPVFLFNAASFIISGICEQLIRYDMKTSVREKLSPGVFVKEVGEVLRFVAGNKGLTQLFGFAMVMNFLIVPVFFIIMPYDFKKVIGFTSAQYGVLQTFFMAGLLVGNIIIGSVFSKAGSRKLMTVGILVQTGILFIFTAAVFPGATRFFGGASWTYFGVLGAALAFIGIFNPAVNVPIQTNLQKMVRSEMRSRFFSVTGLMTQLIVPVGSMLYGFLLDRVPAHLIILGVCAAVAAMTLLFLTFASHEVYEPHLSVNGSVQPEAAS